MPTSRNPDKPAAERAAAAAVAPTSQPEVDRLLEALGGITTAIGSSNETLRSLAGNRTAIPTFDAPLNTYFARVQRRSLPRGSLRLQAGSSFSSAREA
jgi:hypothetical protein